MSDTPVSNTPAPATASQQLANGERAEGTPAAPEAPKKPQRFVEVDGEQIDVETFKKDRNKYKAADTKFREAAEQRKSVESFYEALAKDPKKVLSDPRLPFDRKQLAMDLMREQIEAELLESDPEAKRMSERDRKLKEYEDRENEEKTQKEQAEYQKVVTQRQEALAKTLNAALALTPLAKNPKVQAETLREMASYLRMARQAGHEVSPEELAHHVAGNKLESYRDLADGMDGDELIQFLGEKIAMKIRKADLAKLKKSREVPEPETVAQHEWSPRGEKPKREFTDPNSLKRRK
jgi:hypothetical protein